MLDMNRTMLSTDERIAVVRFLASAQGLTLGELAFRCSLSEAELSERLEHWHFTPRELNTLGEKLKIKSDVKLLLFLNTENEKDVIIY